MYIPKFLQFVPLLPFAVCAGPLPFSRSRLQYALAKYTIPLLPPLKDHDTSGVFAAEVFIGNQVFPLVLDTGSSDTWVTTTDINCTSRVTLQPVSPAECGFFGPRYEPNTSFEVIPDVHLNTSYANGIVINGPLGYTELILGGLTIPRQEISAASYATAGGVQQGGNVSGILGLAFSSLTSAYPGTDPAKDFSCTGNSSCRPVPYPPVLNNLFQNGSIEPVFAFALSRSNKFGGVMTVGGIPRLEDAFINATEATIATSPIKPLGNTTTLNVFTTEVDGLVFEKATPGAGQGRYMVDTGTMVNTVPRKDADAINALFSPPATIDTASGSYMVSCNATAPILGVIIGGQIFYHHPKDMIVHADGQCYSAIQSSLGVGFIPILGGAWLKSVLAIFDVGASKMTFLSRTYYADS